MGKHKITTFERVFNPTVSILALFTSIAFIYFQFFYKEFLIIGVMNDPAHIEYNKADFDVLFQNKGNVTTTIIDCDLVFYQFPGDGYMSEGVKPYVLYNPLDYVPQFNPRRFMDPVTLKPGEQKNVHFTIPIEIKKFDKYVVDYTKNIHVGLIVKYTNTQGRVVNDINELFVYMLEITNGDTSASGDLNLDARMFVLPDEGNFYNAPFWSGSLFIDLYGYIIDSTGRVIPANPDSISKIPEYN